MTLREAEHYLHDDGILNNCLNLHQFITGSFPEVFCDEESFEMCVEALTVKLANWEPTTHKEFQEFDELVRQLVRAAIKEAELHKSRQQHGQAEEQ